MKKIKLTQGKITLVDDEDFELLSKHRWCATKIGNNFYAVRCARNNERVYMHHIITGKPLPGFLIDHINHDGLDNQKRNLRLCSKTQNGMNIKPKVNKLKGITKINEHRRKPWRAQIVVNKKHINLGNFGNEIDAAFAYDAAAKKYFGEFAALNF
jgi:hypothetical protein